MCRLFNFRNTIGLIGAWFIFISTLTLFNLIYSIIEWKYIDKHSIKSKFKEVYRTSLMYLKPKNWWHC